jgi:hypothetical protein
LPVFSAALAIAAMVRASFSLPDFPLLAACRRIPHVVMVSCIDALHVIPLVTASGVSGNTPKPRQLKGG